MFYTLCTPFEDLTIWFNYFFFQPMRLSFFFSTSHPLHTLIVIPPIEYVLCSCSREINPISFGEVETNIWLNSPIVNLVVKPCVSQQKRLYEPITLVYSSIHFHYYWYIISKTADCREFLMICVTDPIGILVKSIMSKSI